MNDTCPLTYPGVDTFGVPAIDRQPCLTSWLDRLAAIALPRPGGPSGPGRDRVADAYVDAQLRHAQKLALAGRLRSAPSAISTTRCWSPAPVST